MKPQDMQQLFDNWTRPWFSRPPADATAAAPLASDPRFKDPAWASTPYGQFLTGWYEAATLSAKSIEDLGAALPEHQKKLWAFCVRNAVDAMSPSNFFLTNPQALQRAVDTQGESVRVGMARMLQDLQNNALPATSDMEAFKVGENLANTPGSVVYQNEIFQLIQYRPL